MTESRDVTSYVAPSTRGRRLFIGQIFAAEGWVSPE